MKINVLNRFVKWLFQSDLKEEEPCHGNVPTEQERQEDNRLHIDDEMPVFLKEDIETDSSRNWADYVASGQETVGEDSGKAEETSSKCIESEQDHKHVSESPLLDNKPLVKMFTECSDLLRDLDRLVKDCKSEREQNLLQMVREKICTAMILSGGTSIDNDESFDIIRHYSLNCDNAVNGMPIQEFVEAGISLEERVMVRAKVNVKI